MKYVFLIILLAFSSWIHGQDIKKINYRGDSVYVYPDSLADIQINLKESLPDGKYYGYLRYDTSLLMLKITYKNNKIDGKVIKYGFDTSLIYSITNYKNGLRHGYWAEFSDDTILHEGNYINGTREGFEYSYCGSKGNKTEYNRSFYKNDTLKYNIWHKYDSTTYIGDTGYVYESNYTRKLLGYGKTFKGNKYGLWKRFYKNGELKSIGNYEIYKIDETQSSSRKSGKWIDFHENGKKSREYYYDTRHKFERITSVYCQYDSLGNLLDSNKFINGIGLYREFYPNGSISVEEQYSNTIFYDYLKFFNRDGSLSLYDKYTKNKRRILIHYYENGKTQSIERYKYWVVPNGLFDTESICDGEQEFYNEDGTLLKIEKFKNGRKVK